jgi:excisionase family DNA binding protein
VPICRHFGASDFGPNMADMGTASHLTSVSGQPTDPAIEPLWSIHLTCIALGGVSRRTILRLLDAGELVRVRVGGRTLVEPSSIRDYIARHRESPAP